MVVCVFFLEEIAGEDAVHRSVLNVDGKVLTRHGDDDVEVQLELVADSLFDGEVVGFDTADPGADFGEGQEDAEDGDHDSPFPSCGCGRCVGWFGLGKRIEGLETAGGFLPERVVVETVFLEGIHFGAD